MQSLIQELKACLLSTGNLTNQDDVINHAVQSTTIYVGERLLKQECLLLLSVNQTFSSYVAKASHSSHLHAEEKVTARWLLSSLIVHLQHHMSYTCRVKKHGTLLYRNNGDLLATISNLLYKSTHETSESEANASASVCTSANQSLMI